MNKQTEALKMAIEALDDIELCDYQTQQKALKACKEALEQHQVLEAISKDVTKQQEYRKFYQSSLVDMVKKQQPTQEYLTRAQQVIRTNNSAQEPVAWTTKFDTTNIWESPESPGEPFTVPLYTHPCVLTHSAPSCTTTKEWVGLRDDDMSIIFDKFDWKEVEIAGEHLDLFAFARAIEQALKEKNT